MEIFHIFFKDSLLIDIAHLRIITDQDKGGRAALSNLLPNVKQFYCTQHHKGNILQRADAKSGKAFAGAVSVWTETGLEGFRGNILAVGGAKISEVCDDEQYPFKGTGIYGRSTSQGVEAMNRAYLPVLFAPIATISLWQLRWIRKDT